nr:hypothetical protein PJ912_13090 [Pectobacterium colocasium]
MHNTNVYCSSTFGNTVTPISRIIQQPLPESYSERWSLSICRLRQRERTPGADLRPDASYGLRRLRHGRCAVSDRPHDCDKQNSRLPAYPANG